MHETLRRRLDPAAAGLVPSAIGLAGLVFAGLFGTACEDGRSPERPPTPPHIVLLIGDDQGYRDFGFMGSPIVQTPNLDRLASEGLLLRNGYSTSSRCRPALRTLLSGLEPLRYHVREAEIREDLASRGLEGSAGQVVRQLATLPRLLGASGYASFQAGKYWEGRFEDGGFDAGMSRGHPHDGRGLVREGLQPVLDFLDGLDGEPFFLWFAPLLPHLPHDPPARLLERYPDSLDARLRAYYASASWLDEGIGELLAALEARGLRENTLIVFLVDNGWQARAGRRMDGPKGKGSLHELGFRTPVLLHGPGRIEPARRDALVSLVDLPPTILDYAGLEVPDDWPGRSLRPLAEGRVARVREQVAGHMLALRRQPGRRESPPSGAFLRRGRWRYLLYSDGGEALYDLASDPDEELDLAPRRPELCAELRGRLLRWVEETTRGVEAQSAWDSSAAAASSHSR